MSGCEASSSLHVRPERDTIRSSRQNSESCLALGGSMGSRKTDPGAGEKHGTIELAYVRLSGNDATLQEAVRTFNTLISRGANGNVLSSPKRVNVLTSGNGANGPE